MHLWKRSSLVVALFVGFFVLSTPASAQDIPEGSTEAVAEFVQGMTLYTSGDYQQALEHLYRAHEMDESFVVPLFFAALCEGNLGSGVPVDSLYQIVLSAKDRLSPYYVYRAESQLAQNQGDRERALDYAWKAAELAPGSKAWYNVAFMAVRQNKPAEARSALMRLDPEVEPMKGWQPYFAELARANDALGRYEEVLRNAATMRETFPGSRGPFWWEVNAYGAMGDMEGLEGVFEAAAASPATGAANTVGAYKVLAGAELKAHGHPQAGLAMYRQAADWYQNAGDAAAGLAHDQWRLLALLGGERLREAATLCDQRLAQYPDNEWLHGMAGTLAARLGDQERLAREKDFALNLAPDRVPPWLPNGMAYFAASEGRAEEAVAGLEQAMEMGYAFNPWWHRDPAFDLIRDHPAFQELIRPKG